MRFKLFNKEDKINDLLENNQPRLVRADSKEVCIVRKGNQLFAFKNECPHMNEKLHQGITNHLNEIICPLHNYRFHMKTGEETNQRCKSLTTYELVHTPEGVFLDC